MWKITDARFPFRDLISQWVALLLPQGVDGRGQRDERNAGLRDGQEGYGESRSERKGSRRGGEGSTAAAPPCARLENACK